MNTKRIIFWACFIIILGLIVWGMIAAGNHQPTAATTHGTPAPISNSDHVRGPEDAPVTLIEYSDFQCPACGAYYPLVEQLMAEASTSVRMVYRHFPLPQHQNAIAAGRASEAAAQQGKFWEMYSMLFVNQTAWENLSPIEAKETFVGYAERLGLDKAAFSAAYESDATAQRVQLNLQEGQTIGIDSTPTFFVNGKAISNPSNYEQFKSIIDAAASAGSR